jgi:hypothetical protein
MEKKNKLKIIACIDRNLLKEVEELTTNKSVLVEQLLMEHANNIGIKNNDIIL